MAQNVRQITYSIEFTATDVGSVALVETLALGEIAPLVPQIGSEVGIRDRVMLVKHVRHQFSSENPERLHDRVIVSGVISEAPDSALED